MRFPGGARAALPMLADVMVVVVVIVVVVVVIIIIIIIEIISDKSIAVNQAPRFFAADVCNVQRRSLT